MIRWWLGWREQRKLILEANVPTGISMFRAIFIDRKSIIDLLQFSFLFIFGDLLLRK